MSEKSLFEKLGGKDAVEAAVDKFYDRVLQDERINYFFKDTDMKKQRNHQKAFLTYAFGGINNYNGRSMRKAHEKLVKEQGLNDSHFDAVVENLATTLQEMGVGGDLIKEVAAVAETVRDDVLNK
ncbi:group I truncated hemoglobin [Candidatus Uabimicrobium amorphum]|uniref:Group 1 truncated hemoglobin n=1 Tax=Uabimicrobium amorphum TaxID=2596890 RepID=A0A5S9F3N2_UABAM|nr:group 1 truncated hemoglobin [Candidatus Uabimicrobium amorphum]BBM83709.1 group 1 truncated hemoglobin [Candidatus Uabimicrobium amorphum]